MPEAPEPPHPIAAFHDWIAKQPGAPALVGRPDATGPLAALHRELDEPSDELGLTDAHRLLSQARAADEKRMMDQLAVDEGWPETWWSPHWHPFASDGAGQLFVVDDRNGRVLAFLHDDEPRDELAPSLEALFAQLLADLQSGVQVYDAEAGILPPADLAEYRVHRERARQQRPPPRGEASPNKALVGMMVPMFLWIGLCLALDLGAGVAGIGAGAVGLLCTGVFTWLGWVRWD